MGTMSLDDSGLWVDPGDIGLEYGYPNPDDMHNTPEFAEGHPCLDILQLPILEGNWEGDWR